MELFDTTLPFAARKSGALTKLITDRVHSFQHGSHRYDAIGLEFGVVAIALRFQPRLVLVQ